MAHAKGVVFALVAARKARQAVQLAQRGHAFAPPGQDFVRVGLVPHIPNNAVFRCIEHIVQSHREFHRAQVGAQVSAGFGDVIEHALAHFVCHTVQVMTWQLAQVLWRIDGLE